MGDSGGLQGYYPSPSASLSSSPNLSGSNGNHSTSSLYESSPLGGKPFYAFPPSGPTAAGNASAGSNMDQQDLEMNLVEYERAVGVTFDLTGTTKPDQRLVQREAEEYCRRVEAHPSGWVLHVELLRRTRRAESKFFALQALQRICSHDERWRGLSLQDRVSLRNAVVSWTVSYPERVAESPKYVRSKLGVVLAMFIKREYPEHWPTAFDDLLSTLNAGAGAADVFLSCLSALDEEIVTQGGPEATKIKDSMRLDAVPKLVQAWAGLIVVYSDSEPELVRRVLGIISLYVSWIDISLVAEDNFASLIFSKCRDYRYRHAAVGFLSKLVRKGMDRSAKTRLIRQLGLADAALELAATCLSIHSGMDPAQSLGLTAPNSLPSPMVPSTWLLSSSLPSPASMLSSSVDAETQNLDASFGVETAKFVDILGLELLDCRGDALQESNLELAQALSPLFERSIAAMFLCMRHPDFQVQRAVLECANRLISSLRLAQGEPAVIEACAFPADTLHRTLHAVLWCVGAPARNNGASASSGNPRSASPPEHFSLEDFEDHRKSVKRLFVNVVRCAASVIVLPFLRQAADYYLPLPTCVNVRSTEEIEGFLFLIHAFGEGAPEIAQRQGAPHEISMFDELLYVVFRSDAGRSHHDPDVVNMYNEVVARYVPSFRYQPVELTLTVLEGITRSGGLAHPHARVRSKAAPLLLRVIRTIGDPLVARLADDLLLALQDSLDLSVAFGSAFAAPPPQQQQEAGSASSSGNNGSNKSSSTGASANGGPSGSGNASASSKPGLKLTDILVLYELVGYIVGATAYQNQQPTQPQATNGPPGELARRSSSTGTTGSGISIIVPTPTSSSTPSSTSSPGALMQSDEEGDARRVSYLSAVLIPLQSNLEASCVRMAQSLESGMLVNPGDFDEGVKWCSAQIEASAAVAKGFPNRVASLVMNLFASVFNTAVMATIKLNELRRSANFSLASVPSMDGLTTNLKRLCHCMMGSLHLEMLSYLPSICTALLDPPSTEQTDISKCFQLLNQMMCVFRKSMEPQLINVFLPMLHAANNRMSPVASRAPQTSHDREELMGLQKELFTFLLMIVSNDLSDVLLAPENSAHLSELLGMVTDGLASIADAGVQRTCAATLQCLVQEWLVSPASSPSSSNQQQQQQQQQMFGGPSAYKSPSKEDGSSSASTSSSSALVTEEVRIAFTRFAFERITPVSFQATAQPHFDPKDASCTALLIAVCSLHRVLAEKCGSAWTSYVATVFLPSVMCPLDVAQEYVEAVVSSKHAKDLRAHYRRLFLSG